MKDIIAFFICLPFLICFIPIYAVQVENDRNMDRVDVIVNAAKEEARQEGYFTQDIQTMIIQNIVNLGFSEDEIIMDVTETPKYRTDAFDTRELIHYKVGVPVDKIIGANRMLGVSDAENRTTYYVRGQVTSERVNT